MTRDELPAFFRRWGNFFGVIQSPILGFSAFDRRRLYVLWMNDRMKLLKVGK